MNSLQTALWIKKQIFMKNNCDQDSQLSKQIVQWYLKNGRSDLPWRKNVTAYRVWISEIMLQQTQVKTVIPFFKKFISKYPNLKSLSSANEEEILALWTGLGFYRRAINIYKAKEIILSDFKNRFPKSFDDIVRLPGIGESTAGAIMSLAYQIPYPILDANVKRVISRYESVGNDSTHKSNKKLWALSNKHTPSKNIFSYTQGIMDLGATICHNSKPNCGICPLQDDCKSAFRVITSKKETKKQNPTKKINFVLARSNDSFLLFKKLEESFWEGLWTPLELDPNHPLPWKDDIETIEEIYIKHKLSHLNLDIKVNIYEYKKIFKLKTNEKYKWVNKSNIDKFGMPKPIKSIIEKS